MYICEPTLGTGGQPAPFLLYAGSCCLWNRKFTRVLWGGMEEAFSQGPGTGPEGWGQPGEQEGVPREGSGGPAAVPALLLPQPNSSLTSWEGRRGGLGEGRHGGWPRPGPRTRLHMSLIQSRNFYKLELHLLLPRLSLTLGAHDLLALSQSSPCLALLSSSVSRFVFPRAL